MYILHILYINYIMIIIKEQLKQTAENWSFYGRHNM